MEPLLADPPRPRDQPTSAAKLPTASRTFAASPASSATDLPRVWNGTDSLIASTTRVPAMLNDLRVSSCAHTPP